MIETFKILSAANDNFLKIFTSRNPSSDRKSSELGSVSCKTRFNSLCNQNVAKKQFFDYCIFERKFVLKP